MEAEPVLEALRAALAAECQAQPIAAYLHGSVARNEATPGSDVDVAVLLGRAPEGTLDDLALDLRDRLEGRIGRRVDLVVLDSAPPDLVHRVLRDGVLLLERDASARVRFEVRARNAYFDLKPYLDEYRRGKVAAG